MENTGQEEFNELPPCVDLVEGIPKHLYELVKGLGN